MDKMIEKMAMYKVAADSMEKVIKKILTDGNVEIPPMIKEDIIIELNLYGKRKYELE